MVKPQYWDMTKWSLNRGGHKSSKRRNRERVCRGEKGKGCVM